MLRTYWCKGYVSGLGHEMSNVVAVAERSTSGAGGGNVRRRSGGESAHSALCAERDRTQTEYDVAGDSRVMLALRPSDTSNVLCSTKKITFISKICK